MKSYSSFNELSCGTMSVSNATHVTVEQSDAVEEFYNNIDHEVGVLQQKLGGAIQHSTTLGGLISAVRTAAGKVVQDTHRSNSDRMSPVGAFTG